MTAIPVELRVVVLTDDPRPEAPERIEMEVRRSLRLWLGEDKVYVEQAVGA